MNVQNAEQRLDALIAIAKETGQSLDDLVQLFLDGDVKTLKAVSDKYSGRPI